MGNGVRSSGGSSCVKIVCWRRRRQVDSSTPVPSVGRHGPTMRPVVAAPGAALPPPRQGCSTLVLPAKPPCRPPLSAPPNERASARRRRCTGGEAAAFLTASPELQILSTPLLLRVRSSLAYRLHSQRLEVHPPPELWDRSLVFHQTAAGRTPSQPALLAATALARAVRNITAMLPDANSERLMPPQDLQVAYVQLQGSTQLGPFSWEADLTAYPGTRAVLARGVLDGVMAEAVAERFARQRGDAMRAAGRMRCGQAQCTAWGANRAGSAGVICCDEQV